MVSRLTDPAVVLAVVGLAAAAAVGAVVAVVAAGAEVGAAVAAAGALVGAAALGLAAGLPQAVATKVAAIAPTMAHCFSAPLLDLWVEKRITLIASPFLYHVFVCNARTSCVHMWLLYVALVNGVRAVVERNVKGR